MLEMMNLSIPKSGGDVPSSEVLPEYLQAQDGVVMFLHPTSGNLYGYGANPLYRLGNGSTTNRQGFTQLRSNCKYFWLGAVSTIIATRDNKLYFVGNTVTFPPLGTGAGRNITTFTEITSYFTAVGITPDDIKTLSLGSNSCRVLLKDGRVFCCGLNSNGECGTGSTGPVDALTYVSAFGNVSKMNTTRYGTHFLRTDGTAWFVGYDAYGEGGIGANGTAALYPAQVASDVSDIIPTTYVTWWVKTNGDVYWAGRNTDASAGTGGTNPAGTVNSPIKNEAVSGTLTGRLLYPLHALSAENTGAPLTNVGDNTLKNGGLNNSGQVGDGVSYSLVYRYIDMVKPAGLESKIVLGLGKDIRRTFVVTTDNNFYACGGATGTGFQTPDGRSSVTPLAFMREFNI